MTKPKGFEVFYLATGKVVHTARGADIRTLCNKPINGVRHCGTPYVTCTPCVRLVAAMAADEKQEAAPNARRRKAELEITVENQNTREKAHMTANDAITAEVKANVERVRSHIADGADADAVAELVMVTEGLLKDLKGTGSVKLRSTLRGELTDALKVMGPEAADAEEPAGDVEKPGSTPLFEGTIITPEMEALVAKGAEAALEGISLGVKMREIGKTVFQIMLAMRKESEYKELPDLNAGAKATRDRAKMIYNRVSDALAVDDVDRADALDELKRSVQNKRSDVLVEYLRGLDVDKEAGLEEVTRYYPEAAAAYLKAKEKETEENPASLTEAVYELYAARDIELPRKGRTEIERERRAAAKELEGGKADESKLTPEARLENYFTTIQGELDKAEKNAAKLNGTQKRKVRNRLKALAARAQELSEQI
ncbi:hypothetical protein [Streptomyces sp. x-80]|uniref:hypothetical protein n=1 Tax=Streptomyces sp. x-80 TaxID=2789282 RepID=UPI00398099CF